MDTTLLTLPEAAARLHRTATVYFVRTLIADGEMPYVRVGKRFFVTSADVDKWIERNRQYATADDGESSGQTRIKHAKSIA
jgi:excisionase family DNA binding protein